MYNNSMSNSILVISHAPNVDVLNTFLSSAVSNAADSSRLHFSVAVPASSESDDSALTAMGNVSLYAYKDEVVGQNDVMNTLLANKVDETHVLVVSSLTTFGASWDAKLIDDLNAAGGTKKKIALSQYDSNIYDNFKLWPEDLETFVDEYVASKSTYPSKLFFGRKVRGEKVSFKPGDDKYIRTNWVSDEMLFGPISILTTLKNESKISNSFNDIYTSMKLFLKGWDVYAVNTMDYLVHKLESNPATMLSNLFMKNTLRRIPRTNETEHIKNLDKFLLFNEGPLAIENPVRVNDKFFELAVNKEQASGIKKLYRKAL